MRTPELAHLKNALLDKLPDVIRALYGERARWCGHEWRLGSVNGEPGGSLAIEGSTPDRRGLWFDHNPAAQHRQGDVLNLIGAALETDFKGAVSWAESFLGGAAAVQASPRYQRRGVPNSTGVKLRSGEAPGPANPRSLKQASSTLATHAAALALLYRRGLKPETVKHFHLGLYSYEGVQGAVTDALSYPLLDAEGMPLKRFLRSRLQGVTKGGPDTKDWAAGAPGTYWVTPAAGKHELLVCEGAKDGWWIWQAVQGTPLADRLCVITSTHGSGVPVAWLEPEFWRGWEKVYLAQDSDPAGDALAQRVRDVASRDVHRARVPAEYGNDWTDYFRSGQTATTLAQLLTHAPLFGVELEAAPEAVTDLPGGTHLVDLRDIGRTAIRDRIYLPLEALEYFSGTPDQLEQPVFPPNVRSLALRSDGLICTVQKPARRTDPETKPVASLSDGTLLARPPASSDTWGSPSSGAISRFRKAREVDKSALLRPQEKLREALNAMFRASSLGVRPEDEILLTLAVFASYALPLFALFPLIELRGSGQQRLAGTLLAVARRGTSLSPTTPAPKAAQLLDRSPGMVVFESLAGILRSSAASEAEQFSQQLVSSVRKETSKDRWLHPDKIRWEHLDFWNVKVICDAAGTPLSGQGLAILTRAGPDGTSLTGVMSENVQDLRDDLWIWTLENAREIATLYRKLTLDTPEPRDALYAPLRTLAALLAGNVPERLEATLSLQTEQPSVGPAEQVLEAARSLVRQGYAKRVSLIHLRLELERLDLESGDNTTDRVKLWCNPRWLGRALRQKRVVDPEDTGERRWLWGYQTRVLTLLPEFVSETFRLEGNTPKYAPPTQPLDFCIRTECRECSYRAFCPLRSTKEQKIKAESER